jgi:hypothetical protein
MLRDWLIGLIVFSMIIVGTSTFYISTMNSYNVTNTNLRQYSTEDFNQTYSMMDNMEEMSGSMEKAVKGGGTSWLDTSLLVAEGVWVAIQLPFQSINWIITLAGDASKEFGLPSWVGGSAIIILTLAIIFAIMAAAFKVPKV